MRAPQMTHLPFRIKAALAALFLMLLVAVFSWLAVTRPWKQVTPQDTFWQAVASAMGQPGITCSTSETTGSQTTKQTVQLKLQSQMSARSVTTVSRQGYAVTTEELNLPAGDFIRYTSIGATKAGVPDVNNVIGVWAKTTPAAGQPSLFGRTVLGGCVVPLADLHEAQIEPLMQKLRQGNVLHVDFNSVKTAQYNGHPARVYQVTAEPQPYVDFMKQVGRVYGLKDLDTISADAYGMSRPPSMQFYISDHPARIQKIIFTGRPRTVVLSDYGTAPNLSAPQHTISADELTKRLISR